MELSVPPLRLFDRKGDRSRLPEAACKTVSWSWPTVFSYLKDGK